MVDSQNRYPSSSQAEELIRKCGGVPKYSGAGDDWHRLFVTCQDGVSRGRLSFEAGVLKAIKCYKKDWVREVDVSDLIFMRLERALRTHAKIVVPEEVFWDMWEAAQEEAKADLARKREWREENPVTGTKLDRRTGKRKPKSRSKLVGKNPRSILREMVQNF